MHDAAIVRGGETLGYGNGDVQQLSKGQTTGRDATTQRLAVDELDAVDFLDRMDGDDVGVIEGGYGQRFALKPAAVMGVIRLQYLEGDVALQPRIVGPVDLAHAASAEQGDDIVRAKALTGSERHGRRGSGFVAAAALARRILEILDPAANAAADLRQAACSEDQDNDENYDHQLGNAQAAHDGSFYFARSSS
jgi:hypothetical protein